MNPRNLPSVHEVLALVSGRAVVPQALAVQMIREELAAVRNGSRPEVGRLDRSHIAEMIRESVEQRLCPTMIPVLNGTGVVLHTGLGRAPFSRTLLHEAARRLEGFAALELNLQTGKRGDRIDHLSPLICSLSGADASLVVNNNAAAVLLTVNSFCEGKEVVVSRGELVEIGGSFRLPDVVAKSGARLREVGTTNRTHLSDYARAIGRATGAVLAVHTSNYRLKGFTHHVPLSELSALCRRKQIPLLYDLGSGALVDLQKEGWPKEPVVREAIHDGADLVTFSGDKLLAGPQAGVICGSKKGIARLAENPLYRALRCDKVTLVLLELTLRAYATSRPSDNLLAYRLLRVPRPFLLRRGQRLLRQLGEALTKKWYLRVVPSTVEAGSGSLPTEELESAAIVFGSKAVSADELARRFRAQAPPVIGYINDGKFTIDLKAILPGQLNVLGSAIRSCLSEGSA